MKNSDSLSWDCWNPQQVKLIETFQRCGCSMVSCYPDGPRNGYVHTVGLEYSQEHPEFLTTDLPKKEGKILVDTLTKMVQDGRRFSVGDVCQVAGGSKVRFASVERKDLPHLFVAEWFYHYAPFRTLKVLAA